MQLEYFYTQQATGVIDIENIGNVALSLTNDLYHEYIAIISTEFGVSEVLLCGPFFIDIENLPQKTTLSYQRLDFNEDKLFKILDTFVNEGKKCITQVTEIDFATAKETVFKLLNLPSCFKI